MPRMPASRRIATQSARYYSKPLIDNSRLCYGAFRMSDEIFRIVVMAAVSLASLAFLVQAGVAIALYRVSRKIQNSTAVFMAKVEPTVARAGVTIEKIEP